MQTGIFSTTGHALSTAFLIVSEPPQQDGAMRRMLIRLLEAVQLPTRMQKDFLANLRGTSCGTIDFEGLTSDEVRAQCAMITQAVTDRLPPPERAAVLGAYTRNPIEKAEVVRFLSQYLKPGADIDSRQRLLYDYCVFRSMPDHIKKMLKGDRVLANLGVSERSAAAYLREMRKRVAALRTLGENRLQVIFEEHGVINAG